MAVKIHPKKLQAATICGWMLALYVIMDGEKVYSTKARYPPVLP
jgi:hypothetical protein